MHDGIGIDFGTTHSTLACATPTTVELGRFDLLGAETSVFRSMLFFEHDAEGPGARPPAWIGNAAIAHYLSTGGDGRLMQSMKSFLASRHVRATNVFGFDYRLEALIALVIDALAARGGVRGLDKPRPPIVAGRPVHFAYARTEADDAFAEARLREAFALAGFDRVTFVLEPVAAALHYEQTLTRDEVVLVADFGGGTSDFCLLRVGPDASRSDPSERILGTAGVGLAGDALDARLVEHLVAPQLGRGGRYLSLSGKLLPLPDGLFQPLKRWHDLSIMKTNTNMSALRSYLKMVTHREPLRAYIELIEADQGYALYRAIEAAKIALSTAQRARFSFDFETISIASDITRVDFEAWIAGEIGQLETALDGLTADAGVALDDVDTVFLTGGTAMVPAIRRIFTDRFGEGRVRTGDFLTSVASGLALAARGSRPAGVIQVEGAHHSPRRSPPASRSR